MANEDGAGILAVIREGTEGGDADDFGVMGPTNRGREARAVSPILGRALDASLQEAHPVHSLRAAGGHGGRDWEAPGFVPTASLRYGSGAKLGPGSCAVSDADEQPGSYR